MGVSKELSTELLLPWFKHHGYTIELERDLYKAERKSQEQNNRIVLLENLRFFNGEVIFGFIFISCFDVKLV